MQVKFTTQYSDAPYPCQKAFVGLVFTYSFKNQDIDQLFSETDQGVSDEKFYKISISLSEWKRKTEQDIGIMRER